MLQESAMNVPQGLLDGKRQHIARRLQVLISLIKDHDEILDIGCGTGGYITDTLGNLPAKITAIDYDEKSIEYAHKHNRHKNVDYRVASGESYRDDKQFDIIVCSHVLEHSMFPDALLKNIKELLKNDGILYLAVPNGYGCFELENFIPRQMMKTQFGNHIINRMMGKVKDTLNHENPHIQFFNMVKLNRMMATNGFYISKVYNEQFFGGVITDRTILKLPYAEKFNMWLGDIVPDQLANGWILLCRKNLKNK